MRCGIYMITCVPTGKRYVGSSIRIPERWSQHKTDLRGGRHINFHMQRAWGKHGESAFTFAILEECAEADLIEREQHYIDTLRPEFNGTAAAEAPMRGRKMSAEHKAKISRALKGRVGNRKGSKMPEVAKRRIGEALRGNTHKRGKPASEETKGKMRAAQRRRRQREAATGGTPAETRAKLRECANKRWLREKKQE